MQVDHRPVTPDELRRAEFKSSVRGYDPDEVTAMLERAAAVIEYLIGDPAAANNEAQVSARELRNADLHEVFRGVNRDEVNQLCERAAATIDSLRPADGIWAEVPQLTEPPLNEWAKAPRQEPRAQPLIGSGASETPPPPSARESVRVALGARTYHVVIGDQLHTEVVAAMRSHGARRAAIITQSAVTSVAAQYATALERAGFTSVMLAIGDGETSKSLATVDALCRQMADFGLLRGDLVVAVGGGVVGDVAGLTASLYYRGIDVVQVPTTLLAMVDAAIGGKTAANLPQGKNLVGAFHQPVGVLCDPTVLSTLPDREYRCGLGEVLKYALMGDSELLAIIDDECEALLARDPEVLRRVITRSAAVKARFVSADEHERTGLREHLNYGHTLAHAIEIAAEHTYAHGEAVGIGLVFAGALAGALERITPEAAARHRDLVERLGLPVDLPPDLRRDDLLTLMRRDKKAVGGLRFVLQGPNGLERVDDPDEVALGVAFSAVGVRS